MGGNDAGGRDAKHNWSFTVTDLEPMEVTRVGKARSGGAGFEDETAVAPASLVARTLGQSTGLGEGTDAGADTLVEITKSRSEGGEVSHSQVDTKAHGSLKDGTLRRPDAARPSVNQGQTIADRYVIEDSIAVGGMGRVHQVKHLHLGKVFALKQMHDSFSSDQSFRAKFYQEARLASGLSHRNIVSIVDFGEDPKLGVFMVMELVDGEPMSRRLRNKERLPLRMACEVILQMADALHYIHSEGIVHGDIKPDNILLRRAGRSELRRWNVCLLDFGLARSHQATNDDEHIEGTPAYMAPEIICGEPLREAADIYSLGILAYQLVTGRPPFLGGLREVMTQHLKDAPKPLAEVLGEEVDERLEALIMKALEKDPKNRHASMAAFLFEMKTLMDMLGFGRRRSKKAALQRTGEFENTNLKLAKLAFEQCGFGMAVVDVNGDIDISNGSFAHFIHKDSSDPSTFTVLDPRFIRIHPDLPLDLKSVNESRQSVRRVLTFKSGKDKVVELIFSLSPLDGEKDKLVMTIVPVL